MSCHLEGSHRQLSKAQGLARQMKQRIRERVGKELRCSIGLAPNAFLAKVASDMQKPDGLTHILKEELPQALFPLELIDLPGIGRRMKERLEAQGVRTVQKICELDSHQLRSIWKGVVGERFYQLLRGENIELPRESPKSMSHQHVLPPEFRNWKKAGMVLRKLLVKAAARLRKERFYAKALKLQVRLLPQGY
jgi:DNA polymerase-4